MAAEIIQVIQEFSTVGGAENVAWELAQAFGRMGIQNSVLAARAAEQTAATVHPTATFASVIPTRGIFRHLGRLLVVPAFTLAVTGAIRKFPSSVIISHGDSFAGDILVVHAVNAENVAEKRRAGQVMWRFNPIHLWVAMRDRIMIGGLRYRRYVAVSPRVAGELKHHYSVPDERIRVISNGIDTRRFVPNAHLRTEARERFGIPAEASLLMFVGHEFDRKGLQYAIEAMGAAQVRNDLWLLVIGSDDESRYRKLAKKLGVNVVFAGEQRRLETIYPAADVFVLPTSYETFSLVCMEAMACGVPVLATRVGGIEDYLVDGVNGFAIERDALTIVPPLEMILSNVEILEKMREGARKTALNYNWDEIASQYIDLVAVVSREKHGLDSSLAAE